MAKLIKVTCLALAVLASAVKSTEWGYLCLRYLEKNDKFYNVQNLETGDE